MEIKSAKFIISNTNPDKCPAPVMPEYAFIGRSNVGKSSLINMLTGNEKLAKTSGKPGKTQLINHFAINQAWYLVDLPGYGFAKAAKSERKKWEEFIQRYLTQRENLMNTFVLLDSRLPPQAIDIEFMNWCGEKSLPFSMVFTKIDKLSSSALQKKKPSLVQKKKCCATGKNCLLFLLLQVARRLEGKNCCITSQKSMLVGVQMSRDLSIFYPFFAYFPPIFPSAINFQEPDAKSLWLF